MKRVTVRSIGVLSALVVALSTVTAVSVAATKGAAAGKATDAKSFIKRTLDGRPDWGGVWRRQGGISFDPNLKRGEVDRPPLTPAYQAKYDYSLKELAGGRPVYDPTADCVPPGGIRLMNMVYPMEIFQRPGLVAIFAEWDHQVRRIYTDGRKPGPDTERTYNGYSTGHWEGDELVVDTVLFKGGDQVITASGLMVSEDVQMHERWKQTDAETLTDTITLTDPKALTAPYTVVKTFKRAPADFEIMDYTCVENNRNPTQNGATGIILSSPGK